MALSSLGGLLGVVVERVKVSVFEYRAAEGFRLEPCNCSALAEPLANSSAAAARLESITRVGVMAYLRFEYVLCVLVALDVSEVQRLAAATARQMLLVRLSDTRAICAAGASSLALRA